MRKHPPAAYVLGFSKTLSEPRRRDLPVSPRQLGSKRAPTRVASAPSRAARTDGVGGGPLHRKTVLALEPHVQNDALGAVPAESVPEPRGAVVPVGVQPGGTDQPDESGPQSVVVINDVHHAGVGRNWLLRVAPSQR